MEDNTKELTYRTENYYTRRFTRVDPKKNKPLLKKHFVKLITERCLSVCMSLYASSLKEHKQESEDNDDLRSEGVELFYTSVYRFNPAKPRYYYLNKKRKSGEFNLSDPLFGTRKFHNFVKQYINLQRPVQKLRKDYGKDFKIFQSGAEEWLIMQFISAFKKPLVWTNMNAIENRNVARDNIKSHQGKETSEADYNEAEIKLQNIPSDDLKELLSLLESQEPECREFLLDWIVDGKKLKRLKTEYPNHNEYIDWFRGVKDYFIKNKV